jgi:CubicO group peptidase (beta-lactamase class C family)
MAAPRRQALALLDSKLADIVHTPGAGLASLVLTLVKDGQLVHEFSSGRAYIAPDIGDGQKPAGGDQVGQPDSLVGNNHAARADKPVQADRPARPDTLYRIASISKPVTTMAALSLWEENRLDLDRDVSDYLGWPLRNPAFPDAPLSCAMLLSHMSSLRDGEVYNMPLGAELREFFEPGGRGWEGGAHFAAPARSRTAGGAASEADLSPGRYFTYCNLGYGVVATVIEKITGERYDRYVKRRILQPLGLEASFNVNLLSDSAFARLAPVYRTDREGSYDPTGQWQAQVDDYRGRRPTLPCPALAGKTAADLESYVPGTNGTLFSPQGGLRASVRDLGRLLRFFIGQDSEGTGHDRDCLDGLRILKAESLDLMMSPRWRFDPAHPNGDCYNGMTRECGLGLMHTTATRDQFGGDMLLPEGGPCLWGHHADAYGLLGGLLFEPDQGYGFAYLIGGTAEDPEKLKGRHSSFYIWEEGIHGAALECLLP